MFQQIIVVGRIGRDAELTLTSHGKSVASVPIATSEKWVDKATGEKREKTQWHRVTLWGKQAESLAKYLKKGNVVQIIGSASASAYIGQDGEPKANLEVTARQIVLLPNQQGGGSSGGYDDYASEYDEPQLPPQELDDIPF